MTVHKEMFCVEHIVDGQHVRHYVQGCANQTTPQKLAIKQYTAGHHKPHDGYATIIALHAHGFPKETYEPLFETLFKRAPFGIRSIWIADVADMGSSAALNEQNLGNHPHYFDHSRDLLHVINLFREQMPMPLIGLAHSMAASQLAFLSHMHPRLFASLIMVEPILTPNDVPNPHGIRKVAVFMPDFWPSRAEAEKTISQNPAYKTFDPRCVQQMIKFSFRETPNLLYPNQNGVTPATSKHQLAFWTTKPWQKGNVDELPQRSPERLRPMDDPIADTSWRQELRDGFRLLQHLHPPVAFIYGKASHYCAPETKKKMIEVTGTAVGGSGGAVLGNVDELFIEGGHFIPFDHVDTTADAIINFTHDHLKKWRSTVGAHMEDWSNKTALEKQTMTEEWPKHVMIIDNEIKRRRSKI